MRPQHPIAGKPRGFTLLELLVAMALSSVVAVLGATALKNSVEFFHRYQGASTERESVRGLEKALQIEWKNRGKRVFLKNGQLEFDTSTPVSTEPLLPGTYRVFLMCEALDDRRWTLRHFVADTSKLPRPEERTALYSKALMVNNLSGCNIEALTQPTPSETKRPALAQWIAAWAEGDAPPFLVRVHANGADGTMPPWVLVGPRQEVSR